MNTVFSVLNDTHINACAHLYCKVYQEAPWFETSELQPIISFIQEHLRNNFFRGYVACCDENIVAVSIGFRKGLNIILTSFSSTRLIRERASGHS